MAWHEFWDGEPALLIDERLRAALRLEHERMAAMTGRRALPKGRDAKQARRAFLKRAGELEDQLRKTDVG